MRKLLLTGTIIAIALGEVLADGGNRKAMPIQKKAVRFESGREIMLRYAQMEQNAAGVTTKVQNVEKRKKNSNQVTSVTYTDLGSSLNPLSVSGTGRNYLSVVPSLNTVALIRRGGANDNGGATALPGNKLLFDYNTQGGSGLWQLSKGPLFSDDNYTSQPGYDVASSNFGPRYPQGVLWNPAGNTDPNNAMVVATGAVLDGTNDTWGGQGRGWSLLSATTPGREAYWPSGDVLHYITDAMEVNANGDIFMSEPEIDASGGTVAFTDKILIYKYSYNSTNASFDSTLIPIAFPNEGGDYASYVGNTCISFSPDGQVGYLLASGYNIAYDSTNTILPYLAKTTDGGTTWSDFKVINFNHKSDEFASPDLDAFRDGLYANYVHFTETEVVPAQRGDEYSHRVDYMFKDFDMTVDQYGYAHIMAQLCITSFGDTLVNDPGVFNFYPGYGSWIADLAIKDFSDTVRATVIGSSGYVRGCFGDCSGTTNSITEDGRPQVARSADGSVISFVWFETDEEAHPPLLDDRNSNPDLWMRSMKVTGEKQFKLSDIPRNMSKGTDNDGLIICGSVAPLMLNTPNGYAVAATAVTLAPTTLISPWPTQHFFIQGLNVATAVDSFPVEVAAGGLRIVKVASPVSGQNSSLKMMASPNPSKGIFAATVSSKEAGIANVKVINMLGQMVSQSEINLPAGESKVPFNISNQNSGMYFITIQQGGKKASYRVVKD